MDALDLNFGNTTMVLLTDAMMGRRRDTNQRGVLEFGIELREKEI